MGIENLGGSTLYILRTARKRKVSRIQKLTVIP